MSTDIFLTDLKQQTAPMHVRLESSRVSVNLMSARVSMENYIDYLKAMYDLTWFTEKEIFPPAGEVIPDIYSRVKLDWLREDLADLQGALLTNVNAYTNISLPTLAEKLGWVYVVEGSTLGGRVILKFLHTKLEGLQEKGGRFLEGYGAETGSRWKEFLQALSRYAVLNNKEEEVISGATKAFEAIHLNFNA